MNSSKFVLFCILTTLVLGVLLLLFKNSQPFKQRLARHLEKITIGRVVGYPDLALIAQSNGYFKNNNLDVSFKAYDSPTPLMKDLRSSTTPLISSTAEYIVVSNSFSNNDLRIISVVSTQDNQWEVIARRDKHIQSTADLKGKRIGVQSKTIGGFLLGRFLSYYGLNNHDIEIENLSREEYSNQLTRGEIDAVVVTSPYANQIKRSLGSNAISWSAQPERSIYSVSYTTKNLIKENPQLIERYLRSLVEAETFVKDHNTEAKNVMQNELHLSPTDMNDIWTKFTFRIELPQELFTTMEDEARWMIENKLTRPTDIPDYSNSIYTKGLEAINPEAVTVLQ